MEQEKNHFYSILWDSEENREEWLSGIRPADEVYVEDLNLRYLCEEVSRLGKFGEKYNFERIFLHPCTRLSTVRFRQRMMELLYTNPSLFHILKELVSSAGETQNCLGRIRGTRDAMGQKIFFLQMLREFLADMRDIFERLLRCAPEGTEFAARCRGLSDGVLGLAATGTLEALEEALSLLEQNMPSRLWINKNQEQNCIDAVIPPEDLLPGTLTEQLEQASSYFLGDYDFSVLVYQNDITDLDKKLREYVDAQSPQLLQQLSGLYEKYKNYVFWPYFQLANESAFYLSCIRFRREYEKAGFYFTMPYFTEHTFTVREAYDMTLGVNLFLEKKGFTAVANDYGFQRGRDRFFILTGANQGGKTTFIRSIGTLQCMAQIGMFVPAREAVLGMVDRVHTLFGREDEEHADVGRFEQELARMRNILKTLGERDMILLNEPFTSTQRRAAVTLLKWLLPKFYDHCCVGGLVTHFHEIFDELPEGHFFSLVADVVQEGDRKQRTYRILRRDSYHQSYARDIAVKCGVTYEQLQELMEAANGRRTAESEQGSAGERKTAENVQESANGREGGEDAAF